MANELLLTTTDNPYNPHTHWVQWYAWDTKAGYDTCALLSRLTITSDDMSESDQDQAIEFAMNSIIEQKAFGSYIKV